jgi:peptide/nickel transport system substrate-binding protein
MKRYTIRLLALMTAALLLLTGMLAYGDEGDTFVWGVGLDMGTFNTVLQDTGISLTAQRFLFPAIFEVDPDTGLPREDDTGLTTWEVSEDGLTYTFTIRDDAFWSDGTPISAEDVKFTYDAIASELVQTWKQPINGTINVIDERTFEIVLATATCSFWSSLGTLVMPAHKFAEDYSDFMTNPLNTAPDISGGQFVFEEWAADEFIRFRANPDYWKGQPAIETMIMRVIPDAEVMTQAMMLGEIDYMSGLTPENAEDLALYDNVVVHIFPNNSWTMVAMNHSDPANPQPAIDADGNRIERDPHPVFGDPNVRRAINMGWNHDDALVIAGEGIQRVTGPVMPSISWAYNHELNPYSYDPEAAAALLEEAGWIVDEETGVRVKDGVPLAFQLDITPAFRGTDQVALIMQDQLGQLGFEVNIETWEPNALLPRVFGKEYEAWIVKFDAGSPDPQVMTEWTLHSSQDMIGGLNLSAFSMPELDELIDRAGTVSGCDIDERAALYQEIQRIAHENAVYDSIHDGVSRLAVSVRLQNFTVGPWAQNDPVEWALSD